MKNKISESLRLLAEHAEQLEADGVTNFWASSGLNAPHITIYDRDGFRRKFAGREVKVQIDGCTKRLTLMDGGVLYEMLEYFEAPKTVAVVEIVEALEPATV